MLADFREVVVVPRLRVCRVERLRVEDASIEPHSQPQPPTRRPVMMDEEASAMIWKTLGPLETRFLPCDMIVEAAGFG